MGTQKTQIIRNKSSPKALPKKFVNQINQVGAGIWRVIGTPQENGEPVKQFSGLLTQMYIDKGDPIYIVVNNGKHRVVVTNTKDCFRHRWLIEPNQANQFIPLTKGNKLTFQPNQVAKILKLSSEELRQQIRNYYKRGKK